MVATNFDKLISRYEELRKISDGIYGEVCGELRGLGVPPLMALTLLCYCDEFDPIEAELLELERQLPDEYTYPGDPPMDSDL